MTVAPDLLTEVPLFALLDKDELAVLAAQVEMKTFAPRQRIYKIGDVAGPGYVVVSGSVKVTTVDEDNQEVIVDQPGGTAALLLKLCWDATIEIGYDGEVSDDGLRAIG